MSLICTFHDIENNYDAYKDKDCMKMFCEFLAMKIINFEKKKIIPLANEKV